MEERDGDAVVFISSDERQVDRESAENPLWAGNSSTVEPVTAEHSQHQAAAQSSCADDSTATQFPGVLQETACPVTRKIYQQQQQQQQQRQEAEQASMMNAYVEKFGSMSPPYSSIRPAMGSCISACPSTRRGLPSVLPSDMDLSYRPGSLQEAICMYIDFLMAENEVRTRISECALASPAPPLDFHREEYYRDVMCRPVNFPTARFRDWLKRYNVDIEITDPDGQTVSQTTFAPATPVSPECVDHGGWMYPEGVPIAVPPARRRQRSATSINHDGVICHDDTGPVQLAHPFLQPQSDSHSETHVKMHGPVDFTSPHVGSVSLYQAPDTAVPRAVEGPCGYGPLPGQDDDIKDELPGPGLPVSGWPDVGLDQPESSRAGTCTVVESRSFDEDNKDQPLSGSSADPYIQDEGSTGSDGCFASDETAAVDQQWTSPEDGVQQHHHAQFSTTSPAHASRSLPALDINSNERATFPMVVEPASLSQDAAIPATNTVGTVVQPFAECFEDGRSANYQFTYHTGSDVDQLHTAGTDS